MTTQFESATADPAERAFLLRHAGEPGLSVRHAPGPGPSLLYVHGSTFPAASSMNYRIDGTSWADDLQSRGFDVWSFDFAGYGGSDRPRPMQDPARGTIPGRASEAVRQIERVVRHVLAQSGRRQLSIIAHSWGTIPAGLFAGRHPEQLDRLILFGPVAERPGQRDSPTSPLLLVSAADQWRSFQSGVPEAGPAVIPEARFNQWAAAYLSTDPTASTRFPPSVAVPSGPDADFADAWSGRLPYDPSMVRSPTLIVRGEWDLITRDEDAAWLVAAMTAVPGGARDLKLPGGAHRMHLESGREALFEAVAAFLGETLR